MIKKIVSNLLLKNFVTIIFLAKSSWEFSYYFFARQIWNLFNKKNLKPWYKNQFESMNKGKYFISYQVSRSSYIPANNSMKIFVYVRNYNSHGWKKVLGLILKINAKFQYFFWLGAKLMQVACTHIHQLACKTIKSRCNHTRILSINVKGHIPPFMRSSL